VFFSGTGTEIPVLGTRAWPEKFKIIDVQGFDVEGPIRKFANI
jgi:hypothetical protein